MAARVLKANVWVGEPVRFFAAGDKPEKKYADLITNPNAWGDGKPVTAADEGA